MRGADVNLNDEDALAADDAGGRILAIIDQALPRSLPDEIKDEVRQEIALQVFAREIELSEIPARASAYVKKHYREYYDRFTTISIDQPLGNDPDGITLGEILTVDAIPEGARESTRRPKTLSPDPTAPGYRPLLSARKARRHKERAALPDRKAKRRAAGLCMDCGAKAAPWLFCPRCRQRQRGYYVKHRALKPVSTTSATVQVATNPPNPKSAEAKRRRQALRESGRCWHCGEVCAPYSECEERRRAKRDGAAVRESERKCRSRQEIAAVFAEIVGADRAEDAVRAIASCEARGLLQVLGVSEVRQRRRRTAS